MTHVPAQADPDSWASQHPDLMLALLRWREAPTPASAANWFRKIDAQMSAITGAPSTTQPKRESK